MTSAEGDGGQPVGDLSYTEASGELDEIVAFFEQREVDVDQLVARLERATAIVDELDRRLRRTRAQVEELVPRLEAATQPPSDAEGESQTESELDVADELVGEIDEALAPGPSGPESPGLF
jgi:exodeoxyribonuclease VII small subunit